MEGGGAAVRSIAAPLPRRELQLIYVLDRSGSMRGGGKIQALNTAIDESTSMLRDVGRESLTAAFTVRVATFADGASWHVESPTSTEEFTWTPLEADGFSDLGAGLALVAAALDGVQPDSGALPPVVILVSDGQPTDDYRAGLAALRATAWGDRMLRIAIAIGRDADIDVLREFMGPDRRFEPSRANDPEAILEAIGWATMAASRLADGRLGGLGPVDADIFDLDDPAFGRASDGGSGRDTGQADDAASG